jgi:hypothetical protein
MRPKKHVATTMTCRRGEIFLVKCQKQVFSFNKREVKVYCYSACFEECIKLNSKFCFCLVSCPLGGARVLARYAKMPWLEPWLV